VAQRRAAAPQAQRQQAQHAGEDGARRLTAAVVQHRRVLYDYDVQQPHDSLHLARLARGWRQSESQRARMLYQSGDVAAKQRRPRKAAVSAKGGAPPRTELFRAQ